MGHHTRPCVAIGSALALLVGAVGPAVAQVSRAWVSGHGTDQAGCGAPVNPCRSLQYVHDHIVSAGGEIDILDPAGYGAINITKSISIVNDGVGTAGVQTTSGEAITVNAPGGVVYLRGLNIDGVENAGSDGVLFSQGASLSIRDCVIQHFVHQGIFLQVTSGTASVSVINTTVSENSGFGILENGLTNATINFVFDHIVAQRDETGLAVAGAGSPTFQVTLTNSLFANNLAHGVSLIAPAGTMLAVVDQITSTLNGANGLNNSQNGVVHLSRSVLSQNGGDGIVTTGSPSPTWAVISANNNLIVGNTGGNVSGTLQGDTLR